MGHQELHLIGKNTPIAQDEILPEVGDIGSVQQGHVGLLGCTAALAMVAGPAGRHNIHPDINAILRKRDDVLARQAFFGVLLTTISAYVPIARKQLAVSQTWLQIERIDVRHTLGTDDAVDRDDGLLARSRVVATVKNGDFSARLPAHLPSRIVNDGLFERDPGLGQSLGRQLQDLQHTPPETTYQYVGINCF